MGLRDHVLGGGLDPPKERGNSCEGDIPDGPTKKIYGLRCGLMLP